MRTTILLLALATITGAPAVIAAESSSSSAPKTPSAKDLFAKGVAAMDADDLDNARTYFEDVLEQEPDVAEAHNNLGYCLRKLDESLWNEALAHYDRALELDPKLAQAYHYRGVLPALAGREAAAKADHAALVELDATLADRLMEVIATGAEPTGDDGLTRAW